VLDLRKLAGRRLIKTLGLSLGDREIVDSKSVETDVSEVLVPVGLA